MGGAYTAVADDVSGLYYNPAGIVYSTGRNLSGSLNAYFNSVKSYKGVIGGQDWNRKSSALLPNYFGVIQPLGKFKIGLSYAVPDSIQEDQDQVFLNTSQDVGRFIINFNNSDTIYNFGPSLALELQPDLAAGLTLYYYRRHQQVILNQVVNLSNNTPADLTDDTNEWTNTYVETTESGFRPVLGFMWSPVERLSIGLSVSKVFLTDAIVVGQITCSSSTTVGCAAITGAATPFFPTLADPVPTLNTTEKRKHPLNIALGTAYFPSDSLLLSADLKYYTKTTDAIFGDREAVLNMALGAEYFLSKNYALRAGLFTDIANTPEVVAGGVGQPENLDIYGASLSISHFTRNTAVSFGGNFTMGEGKAQIVGRDPVTGLQPVQNIETVGWMLFLSSSYSY